MIAKKHEVLVMPAIAGIPGFEDVIVVALLPTPGLLFPTAAGDRRIVISRAVQVAGSIDRQDCSGSRTERRYGRRGKYSLKAQPEFVFCKSEHCGRAMYRKSPRCRKDCLRCPGPDKQGEDALGYRMHRGRSLSIGHLKASTGKQLHRGMRRRWQLRRDCRHCPAAPGLDRRHRDLR